MNKKTAEHQANINIWRIIEAEALEMGLEAFFEKHTYGFEGPETGQDLRAFAKEATRINGLPEWCSFSAFFEKFEDRFAAWYETGNRDARPGPAED